MSLFARKISLIFETAEPPHPLQPVRLCVNVNFCYPISEQLHKGITAKLPQRASLNNSPQPAWVEAVMRATRTCAVCDSLGRVENYDNDL